MNFSGLIKINKKGVKIFFVQQIRSVTQPKVKQYQNNGRVALKRYDDVISGSTCTLHVVSSFLECPSGLGSSEGHVHEAGETLRAWLKRWLRQPVHEQQSGLNPFSEVKMIQNLLSQWQKSTKVSVARMCDESEHSF